MDSFAFGMVLFELLTGERPDAMDLLEFVTEHVSGTKEFAKALDKRVTDWDNADALHVARLAMKCQERFCKGRMLMQDAAPALQDIAEDAGIRV
jgi:hypothetical protein